MELLGLVEANASSFPWLGLLKTSFPNPTKGPGGLEIGTGSLIGPRLVLTAGHMVYDPDQGGQAISVNLSFGGLGFLSITATEVDFPKEWRNPRSDLDSSVVSPVDIGVIILPQPIDRFVTPMPFETASDTVLTGTLLSVGGYPASPPAGSLGTLWGNSFNVVQGSALGDLAAYEDFRLFYSVATLPGMSGAPVYSFDPVSSIRIIRGIHTSFIDNEFIASALRISEDIYHLIQGWLTAFRPV
jgi:glutamyl endopeptidase